MPVYDARSAPDLQLPHDIKTYQTLPEFPGDVPEGSLVFVAYTANLYESANRGDNKAGGSGEAVSRQTSLSQNIQFVVVLAAPEL